MRSDLCTIIQVPNVAIPFIFDPPRTYNVVSALTGKFPSELAVKSLESLLSDCAGSVSIKLKRVKKTHRNEREKTRTKVYVR